MKRFNFRLQKVLHLRKAYETQQKNKYLAKLREYVSLVEEAHKARNTISKWASVPRDFPIQLKILGTSFTVGLLAYANKKLQEAQHKMVEVEAERQKYLKKRQERKAIEILKDKAFKRYVQYVNKEEQKELDDISNALKLVKKNNGVDTI